MVDVVAGFGWSTYALEAPYYISVQWQFVRFFFFCFSLKTSGYFPQTVQKMTSYWEFTERFQIELDSAFRVRDRKKKGNCLGGKKTPDGQKALWGTGTCNSPLLIYLCYPLPCPSLPPLLPACPLSGSLFLHPASHGISRCDAKICSLTMAELWKQLYTRRMKGFCRLKIPLECKICITNSRWDKEIAFISYYCSDYPFGGKSEVRMLTYLNFKIVIWGRRDGSAMKNTHRSSRGP